MRIEHLRYPAFAALLLLATTCIAQAPGWTGAVNAVVQSASDPALDHGATLSADVVGEYGTAAGLLTLVLEAASTVPAGSVAGRVPQSNGDAGSAQDGDGNGRAQVSELKLAIDAGARGTLTIGVLDPPTYMDQSRIASDENTQFLAQNFVQNPTIEFPDFVPGLVYARDARPGAAGFTVLLAASQGLADTPGRTYAEMFDVSESGRGVFASVGGTWKAAGAGTRVGAWVQTADHSRLDGSGTQGNHGVYLVQSLETPVGHLSLRAGWANPQVSTATAYVGLAWQRAWQDWVVGAAAAGIAASPDAPGSAEDSLDVEVYLRRALGYGLYLTPSLQYFRNPGLDGSGAVVDRSLGVANLRLSWLW